MDYDRQHKWNALLKQQKQCMHGETWQKLREERWALYAEPVRKYWWQFWRAAATKTNNAE